MGIHLQPYPRLPSPGSIFAGERTRVGCVSRCMRIYVIKQRKLRRLKYATICVCLCVRENIIFFSLCFLFKRHFSEKFSFEQGDDFSILGRGLFCNTLFVLTYFPSFNILILIFIDSSSKPCFNGTELATEF